MKIILECASVNSYNNKTPFIFTAFSRYVPKRVSIKTMDRRLKKTHSMTSCRTIPGKTPSDTGAVCTSNMFLLCGSSEGCPVMAFLTFVSYGF